MRMEILLVVEYDETRKAKGRVYSLVVESNDRAHMQHVDTTRSGILFAFCWMLDKFMFDKGML